MLPSYSSDPSRSRCQAIDKVWIFPSIAYAPANYLPCYPRCSWPNAHPDTNTQGQSALEVFLPIQHPTHSMNPNNTTTFRDRRRDFPSCGSPPESDLPCVTSAGGLTARSRCSSSEPCSATATSRSTPSLRCVKCDDDIELAAQEELEFKTLMARLGTVGFNSEMKSFLFFPSFCWLRSAVAGATLSGAADQESRAHVRVVVKGQK
ncbi:hypothetical protein BC828DRAFT_39780 [Blastocladiella britannica]|nr:hypothetical protein BC828DRAFT_39780 [Blastocladiella britannica]